MRFSTQEVSGNRARLRYSVELDDMVDDPANGFMPPVHPELAISTAG
jgi:hypothetical protein